MKPACGRAAAIVCFFVFPVLSLASPMAAENDCDALLESLSASGEIPAIVIDPTNETVKIATSRGVCTESIEAWSKREPLKAGKSPAKKPARKRKKRTEPAQVIVKPVPVEKPVPAPAPAPEPTTVVVKPVPIEKPAPAPAPKPEPASMPPLEPVVPTAPPGPAMPLRTTPQALPCDYRLKEIWGSQVLAIEGIKHWLSRAFTLDLDGDRKVDNVSFTFVAKGDTKTVIHYFGVAGQLSGWSYPALKLPDENVIERLCFDDVTYEKPKFFEDAPLKTKWIELDKPDLAGEMEAKEKGVAYKKKTKKKKKKKPEKESTPWWIWALIGAGVLAGAAGLWAFLGGKAGDDEDEEDEDGEDEGRGSDIDDDEDEDEKPRKSKFSLGGLFKRSKKKGADGEDEDDEDGRGLDDDEDEDEKPRKSKFSLGGLFKRSKKKGKDGNDGDDEDDGDDESDGNDEGDEGEDDEDDKGEGDKEEK